MKAKDKLFKKIFAWIRIVVYLSIAYIIYELLSNSTTLNCYIKEKYGVLCPGCGATRSTLSIIKGNFKNAIKYNLVYAVSIFPLFAVLILEDIYTLIEAIFRKNKRLSLIETFFEIEEDEDEQYS